MKSHPRRLVDASTHGEVVKELQERFLHDVFGVLVVMQEDRCEPIHGGAVLFEQVFRRLRWVHGVFHIPATMYNGPAARL